MKGHHMVSHPQIWVDRKKIMLCWNLEDQNMIVFCLFVVVVVVVDDVVIFKSNVVVLHYFYGDISFCSHFLIHCKLGFSYSL
jgi:hypothetical protein